MRKLGRFQKAERLAGQRNSHHGYLAMLWRAIGDQAQAKKHTLAGREWVWSDGEPYVNRYELNRAAELLWEIKIPPPDLPPYGR